MDGDLARGRFPAQVLPMTVTDRLRGAGNCAECRSTRRVALLLIALCVLSWMVI